MNVDVNKFIDFYELFDALYNDQKDTLREHQYECDHYNTLIGFTEESRPFEILSDECTLANTEITFVFGYDYNDANESNNQSTTAIYYIVFNRVLDEFTLCTYEAG